MFLDRFIQNILLILTWTVIVVPFSHTSVVKVSATTTQSETKHSHQKGTTTMSSNTHDEHNNNNDEPNPPQWPETVKIFRDTESTEDILATIKETEDSFIEEANTYSTDYHFSNRRWALLFTPGIYENLDFEVGYYVQVAGLGSSADDVVFQNCNKGPHVSALNKHLHPPDGSSLDTFWRSAENFASYASDGMRWAVSQAAPLRRVHIGSNLHLHDGGAYASGGHLANSIVNGHTYFGGQQQFLSRNVEFQDGASGGAWSLVFVGCTGNVPMADAGSSTSSSTTVTETPHVRIEKPYIAMQKDDKTKFQLRIPKVMREDELVIGPHIHGDFDEIRDFTRVAVISPPINKEDVAGTTPTSTTAADTNDDVTHRIQEALDQGKDVLLSPGIYHLTQTLKIRTDNQVLLGLGLATLVAPLDDRSPCLQVMAGTTGVRIGGIMLEASELNNNNPFPEAVKGSSLLEWGEEGVVDPGNFDNPNAMFDVFCRVGGGAGDRNQIAIDTMMKIHSGHVIGDNIWLWRADHSVLGENEEANYPHISPIFHQNEQDENRVETGITVLGDDVTFFGLAVEHANGHQTIWSGERGLVHFYQCEFPYDVSRDFGHHGYRGYLVTDTVKHHKVHGAGIYSNFRNDIVKVAMAIQYPEHRDGIHCVNPFTVHLDNNGFIASVANGMGGVANKQGQPVRVDNPSGLN